MTYALGIVAHPDRKKHATWLEERLNPEVVVWDDAGYGAGRNHLRAWEWLAGSPTQWSVVLEDDAIPCKDFPDQLRRALAVAPTPIVSLYLGRGRPLTVDGFDWPNRIAAGIARDVCWLTAPGLASCVAVAVRTKLVPSLLSVVPLLLENRPIDQAIGQWAHLGLGLDVSYTRPSLVNHRAIQTLIPASERIDGQERDGKTMTAFTEAGKELPEVRQAWVFGTRQYWDKSLHAL